jgi:UPF0755 protein
VKFVALAALLAALLLALFAGGVARGLVGAADRDAAEQTFEVEAGEPLSQVARRLAEAGLLRETPFFGPRTLVLYARLRGIDRQVKSGEYDLSAALAPTEIVAKLVAGEVKTHAVTLPPGWHAREIAARLEALDIAPAEEIVALAFDPDFAHSLGLEADSLEGYLYPETYRFRRQTPADEVLRQLVQHFWDAWSEQDREQLAAQRWSLHQVVTLASIVEKETGAGFERPRIASVFDNRLKRRMRLQSDPTVIYGILVTRGEFDGNIRRRDLEADTPYNTYTRGGIPPGPIASPGMASIRAVLTPEHSKFLYFVSQNDGTHFFSTRLKDHQNAVNRFQKNHRSSGS